MVDRYRCYGWDTRRGDMRREDDGNFVSYSDYAKLEAQLAELEAENERHAASIEILRRHAFHWKDRAVAAEYLASTDAMKVRDKPTIHAVFECSENSIIGSTDAPIKRVMAEDDGSFTVVIDHWPVPEGHRVKVPHGQTPLNDDLGHRLLDVINEGQKARETGGCSPYHSHSLEHCLHATGWVSADLRIALDERPASPEAQQEPVAWLTNIGWVDNPRYTVSFKGDKTGCENFPVYTRPSESSTSGEQAVTEAMVATVYATLLFAMPDEAVGIINRDPSYSFDDIVRRVLKAAMESGR